MSDNSVAVPTYLKGFLERFFLPHPCTVNLAASVNESSPKRNDSELSNKTGDQRIVFLLCTFSSVLSLGQIGSFWGHAGTCGDMRDDSAEIFFRSFLQEALVSSSGTGRDVYSLMVSIQHFLSRPRRRPPSKVPCRLVLERLS